MIAAASIAVRSLMNYHFHQSALLYVGMPFVIAILLVLIRPVKVGSNWKTVYLYWLIDSFIIMLGSSVVLFEGFVCVLMFIPIYLIIVLIVFVLDFLVRKFNAKKQYGVKVHLFPLFILISAFEGVSPEVSFSRQEQVTVTREVNLSIAEIKSNLQKPMNLQKSRPWFLHIFPMPYAIHAGSLSQGDQHIIHFRYYRWFVTNMHEGSMVLEITQVKDNYIKTTFQKDTSYIANYLKLKGTEIILTEKGAHTTEVTMRMHYERTLDPYWYFAPLTRYGIRKTAEFLLAEVIAHE